MAINLFNNIRQHNLPRKTLQHPVQFHNPTNNLIIEAMLL